MIRRIFLLNNIANNFFSTIILTVQVSTLIGVRAERVMICRVAPPAPGRPVAVQAEAVPLNSGRGSRRPFPAGVVADGVGRQRKTITTASTRCVRVTALGHGGNALAARGGGGPYVVYAGVASLATAGVTFHPKPASAAYVEA